MGHLSCFLFLLFLISFSQEGESWGYWFPSSNKNPSKKTAISNGFDAEFSMEPFINSKLVEKDRLEVASSKVCEHNAYLILGAGCSEIMADTSKEMLRRLAWYFTDCYQKDSGRPSFPSCDANTPMNVCLEKLKEFDHQTYTKFYIKTEFDCYRLQADVFKQDTERLVNDLKKSAQFAEVKLENLEERSEQLLLNSNQIGDSLTSIDIRTQQMALTSNDVATQLDDVLKHSKDIFEQSKGIVASQSELQEGQVELKEKLAAGMEMLHDSYQSLDKEIDNLRNDAVEIQTEINKVAVLMSMKMESLQNKANDIENVAGMSLNKQKLLLDGQSKALDGLDFLTKFQSEALEESRITFLKLAELSDKHQEELLQRQEQLQQAHDHLIESSKSILAAQEAFESKQESMFKSLEKLFMLHKILLEESRLAKAFLFYCFTIFILYMITSAKQTYPVRSQLYLGLCLTFMVEFAMIQFDHQTWIASKIGPRSLFLLVASVQILHSIFTYRDYEMLNHQMLLTLIEKVNTMERNKYLSFDREYESDIDLCSWIDTELQDDEGYCKDPDYMLPEEVAENSFRTSSFSRRYDLRPRLLR